jgi:hypothetical protein
MISMYLDTAGLRNWAGNGLSWPIVMPAHAQTKPNP